MDDYFIYGATIPNITEEEIDKLKDIIAESYAENENIIINNDFLNNKIETMREQEGLSQKEQEPEEAQKVTKTIQELKQDQLARTQKKDVVKEEIFEKIIDYFLNLPKDDRVIDGQKLIDMFIKESDTEGILTVDDKLEILEGFANYARAELDKSQLRNLIIQKQEQQRKTLTWDDAIEILSEQEKAKESTKMRKHFYKQALHNIIHNDAEQSVIRERQEYINKLNVEEKLLKLGYAKEDLSKMGPIGMLLTLAKLGDKWSIHELAKNSDKYIKLLEQERKMGRVTPDEEDLILKLSEYRQQI